MNFSNPDNAVTAVVQLDEGAQLTSRREVIQSYIMTSARYDFSVDEKRVLTRLVEILQPLIEGKKLAGKVEQDLWDNYHLILKISDLLDEGEKYTRIRDALFSLNEKSFIYRDEEIEEKIRIVEMPKIYKKGRVEFWLNPKIVDAFLNFTKGYNKYQLEISLSLSSVYSMRIYELISGQQRALRYSFSTLKQMFGVSGKYERNHDFMTKVLDVAKKELDAKAPWTFEYKPYKKGRAYEGIYIYPEYQKELDSQNVKDADIKRRTSLMWLIDKETRDYLRHTCDFSDREIKNNDDTFKNAVKLFGDRLPEMIRDIWGRARTARNPKGYMISALKNEITNNI